MKKLIVFSLAVIIGTSLLSFKNLEREKLAGNIEGIVSDKVSNEKIAFANVFLLKNSQQVEATLTDFDGKFIFKEIPAGNYDLKIQYLGYDNHLEKNVRVLADKTTDIKILMKENLVELESITVDIYQHNKINHKAEKQVAIGMPLMMQESISDYGYINHNTEEYDVINENIFKNSTKAPLSTFSIDVDNASYSNVRRMINMGQLPQKDMVRIEEMINYFTYNYKKPNDEHPFSINTEISTAPWNEKHQLVHIGLQGKKLNYNELAPSNLVFLIDVSGSMNTPSRLPLVKASLKMLLNELDADDRVAIVVYASQVGVILPSTPVAKKEEIIKVIDNLEARGSTAGGSGIQQAYKTAKENFIEGGNNRVILATDGDFNVGVSSTAALVEMIKEYQKDNIYLTIAGFGMGNYKDGRMEQISNAGNGNYYYIDNVQEAKKVFVTEMRATLFTIAKDVKIQVEFNPSKVEAYRLIGYENRTLRDEDFNNDKVDAGELGAGHSVTALYEIIPKGVKSEFVKDIDDLKYQTQKNELPKTDFSDEILTVKFRYKKPDGDKSILIVESFKDKITPLNKASDNFKFSAAVASFGMMLRNSEFKGNSSHEMILELAKVSKDKDEEGYRAEFIKLVQSSGLLAEAQAP